LAFLLVKTTRHIKVITTEIISSVLEIRRNLLSSDTPMGLSLGRCSFVMARSSIKFLAIALHLLGFKWTIWRKSKDKGTAREMDHSRTGHLVMRDSWMRMV